ncbi:MAG: YciI family protein [Proteobacteria bacterium]|nr:YciI family protein [Pseudomonadota bacterium]
MLYAIISEDVANSLALRLIARPAHIKRLQDLQDAGRLVLAGPHPAIGSDNPDAAGFTGSLIVAEFESPQDAQLWADADPYVAAKVYSTVTIKPFKKVFPQ